MSELWIKNRSESDLRSCELAYLWFVSGFICNCLISYFTTAKISFTSILCLFSKKRIWEELFDLNCQLYPFPSILFANDGQLARNASIKRIRCLLVLKCI